MKKRLRIDLIISSALFLLFVGSFVGSFVIAKEANNIEYIRSENDFDKVRNNLSGHFIFTPDSAVNLSDEWIPIGTEEKPFTGYFEGNFYTINVTHGFSNKFTDSAENSDLILGIFGVNNGIVKHLDVKYDDFIINKLDSKIYSSIVFGGLCGFNHGYITGCSSLLPELKFSSNFGRATIGGLVGVNDGQIQGCTYNSHFSIKADVDINVGCISGVTQVGSVIKFCYRSGFAFYTLNGIVNNAGYCVGLCKGGSFENIGFSSIDDSSNPLKMRLYSSHKPSNASCGVLIGKIDAASDVIISKVVIDFETDDVYFDELSFGFLCGIASLNDFSVNVQDCCCSGKLFNKRTEGINKFGIFASEDKDDGIVAINSYLYNMEYNSKIFNYCNFVESTYSSLSLSLLNFDESVWIKGTNHFYLNYEKKVY